MQVQGILHPNGHVFMAKPAHSPLAKRPLPHPVRHVRDCNISRYQSIIGTASGDSFNFPAPGTYACKPRNAHIQVLKGLASSQVTEGELGTKRSRYTNPVGAHAGPVGQLGVGCWPDSSHASGVQTSPAPMRLPRGAPRAPPSGCARLQMHNIPGQAHAASAPPGMSQEVSGVAFLPRGTEAELVRQLKGLIRQLDAQTCMAVKDSLYRLSLDANAAEAGRGSTAPPAPMDRVMANLLFNRI